MNDDGALAGRIRESLDELTQVVNRAGALAAKATSSGDEDYWDGVALSLAGFYTGVERVLEDIARTVDGALPSGPDWQQKLLLQMSSAVTERRPPMLSRATRHSLDAYRGFRHVVRSLYAFSLDRRRIGELANGLALSFAAVRTELLAFAMLLEQAD